MAKKMDPILAALWDNWERLDATRTELYLTICAMRDRCEELGLEKEAKRHRWYIEHWAMFDGFARIPYKRC